MSSKDQYKKFASSVELPLFFQPHWLDASELPWDVVSFVKDNQHAYWVYHYEKKAGFRFIRNPHLTPYTGLIFEHTFNNTPLKQVMIDDLIKQLPSFDVLELNLHHSIEQDLIFHGWHQEPHKTNLIDLSDPIEIYQRFKPSIKRQIRKAERSLHIVELDDIELFYHLHEATFLKQQKKPSISLEIYRRYWQQCKQQNCGRLLFIQDEFQQTHAALMLVFDQSSAYYLAGGTNADYYGNGAMSKLMWHAIELSIRMQKKHFDFEGSMIPNIDRFFKNFSPVEIQYTHVQKTQSLIYKMYAHIAK